MERRDTNFPRKGRGSPHTLLSVVIPCFDEAAVFRETHRRLVATLETIPEIDFELVYVDDGSRDATPKLLQEFQRVDVHVRVLFLSRNFGHQTAITAGMSESAGDTVVIIDADLQDPPEVILEMLDRWRSGADVAYGVRTERDGETQFKCLTARAFYRIIGCIADVAIPLDAGDFRLMDRMVVDVFLTMPERDRFVRGMVAWTGFRQEPILYQRAARPAGATKYPFVKMLRFAADAVVSFSLAALRLATCVGLLTTGLALSGIIYALVSRFLTDTWISGWTSLLIAILFLGGVQLVLLGILGEYLGRVYSEVKRRPLYLVKERLGFPPTSRPVAREEPVNE